jgi:hypothetical protein
LGEVGSLRIGNDPTVEPLDQTRPPPSRPLKKIEMYDTTVPEWGAWIIWPPPT